MSRCASKVMGILVFTVAVLWPAVASAHVAVSPETAVAGLIVDLTFTIPSEDPVSPTTAVKVKFPATGTVSSLQPMFIQGWSASVDSLAADGPTVLWRGGQIVPNTSAQFTVTVRLPDDVDRMVIAAAQTYANGTVVLWRDETPAGGSEPEHPAPVVQITGATTTTTATTSLPSTTTAPSASNDTTGTSTAPKETPKTSSNSSGLTVGRVFIGVGIALVCFLVLRTRQLQRRRRRSDGGEGKGSDSDRASDSGESSEQG